MRKKLKSSEKIGFFHSVMSKNWTHDLPIFKGAFERGNQVWKEQIEHILLSVRWGKSWNLLRKLAFFHSVMSKNWTHDLPIFKGAFEEGNQGCKRAKEHLALGHMSKNVKSSEIFEVENWGKNTFLGARGQGGRRRGSTPMSRAPLRVPTKLFFPRSYVEKRNSFWDIINSQKSTETVKHRNFRISIKNFSLDFSLDPKESESEKNKKVSFSKFDTFPPPAS